MIDADRLPPSLRERDGIPSASALQEWTPAGGEILLAGEVLLEPNGLNFNVKFHLFDLVERKHIVGKQYEGPLQTLRPAIHRMADEILLQITGEKGVHNTKIAYALAQGAGKEILSLTSTVPTSNSSTQNQSINLSRAWSPKGEEVLLPLTYLRRNPDLYLIDVEGRNLQPLSRHPGLTSPPPGRPMGRRLPS